MEESIEKLEARVKELEDTNRLMSGAIKLLRERMDVLEKTPAKAPSEPSEPKSFEPSGTRTFGPPKKRAKQQLRPAHQDGEHVVPDPMWAKTIEREERKRAGLWAGRNQMIVTLCDEPGCVAGHHRKVMSKQDGAAFNSQRVGMELAKLDKQEVRAIIESASTEVEGGHWIYGGSAFQLPSGRNISFNRAVQWAFNDHVGEVPRFIKSTCGRGDCSAPAHLKVER